MKRPYEIHQEIEMEREAEELKVIIDKPFLDSETIWNMYPNNFYKWRVKHDYPRILSHFSKKLQSFDTWKKEYGFTDEMLMQFGISNCINPNPSKDKRKFIVERTLEKERTKFISYQNIDKKHYRLGPNPVNHKVLSEFIGYIDWCNLKRIKIMPDWRDNSILSRFSSSHPVGQPLNIQISILDGLELLKIGGIEVKSDAFGMIKPKYFEFTNANHLVLSGRLSTGGHQLIFENSYIDNLICSDFDLSLVEFRNCKASNIQASNSNFQQWGFSLSNISGKAYNSDFKKVSIFGGSFDIDFKDCTFYQVDARPINKNDISLDNTFRTFKKVYANQGDDKKAIEYFLLEKAVERIKTKHQIFSYQRWGIFTETKFEKFKNNLIHTLSSTLKFLSLWINNFYWGYGRKPFRVVRNSLIIIIAYSFFYYFLQTHFKMPEHQTSMTILDCIYYSSSTFTTLSFGDFIPLGHLRVLAASEALFGGLSLGFLVAGFSNFKY
ncbi:MAG: potassium channel family protein [Bacilli bacterium]